MNYCVDIIESSSTIQSFCTARSLGKPLLKGTLAAAFLGPSSNCSAVPTHHAPLLACFGGDSYVGCGVRTNIFVEEIVGKPIYGG